MAFWCRINRFKLKHLPNQIVQRYYLGNSNASHTNPCVAEKPYWVIHSGPISFCNNVRFFAAPVQVMIWVWQFADYLSILLEGKKKKSVTGCWVFCIFLFSGLDSIICVMVQFVDHLAFGVNVYFFFFFWRGWLVLMGSCRCIIEFSLCAVSWIYESVNC